MRTPEPSASPKTLNSVSGVTTNIIVLDACRVNEADNTFKGGSDEDTGLSMKEPIRVRCRFRVRFPGFGHRTLVW